MATDSRKEPREVSPGLAALMRNIWHPMGIWSRGLAVALSLASLAGGVACVMHRADHASHALPSFSPMPDHKQWLTDNLSVNVRGSYCYQGDTLTCHRYGRLYTWDAAQQACRSLNGGWRLPTEDDWRHLAAEYGGVYGESVDSGKSAYRSLMTGGSSRFNALLGGGAEPGAREYSRLEAHGFYWTATESGPASATFMNFGRGSQALYRQPEGEKQRAFSVRCVRDN